MNKLYTNYDLKNVTHSRLSALAKFYLETDQLYIVKNLIKDSNSLFIGNASKIVFAFDYMKYFVIKYKKQNISLLHNYLIVDSGCSLFQVGSFTIDHGIKGFEKIMTIPGLVGGSVVNNVSFLGQCISDYLFSIELIDSDGKRRILYKNEIEFSYRKMKLRYDKYFISKVIFNIVFDSKNNLEKSKQEAYLYRKMNQPNALSLGSTFKNAQNIQAYKLIEKHITFDAFNGFKISDKHKNFIEINKDLDKLNLVKLIERIQEVLYNKVGIFLETEIIIVY